MAVEDPRIGLWDVYQQQGNPLVVEEEGSWRELHLSELVSLAVAEYRRQESARLGDQHRQSIQPYKDGLK